MDIHLFRVIQPVDDIERAAAFYGALFGEEGIRVSPGRHYFSCGGTLLACYDPKADGDSVGDGWKKHPYEYLYFSVEKLDEIFLRLKASDARFVADFIRDMPWGERSLYAQDPFGNPICFVQRGTEYDGE